MPLRQLALNAEIQGDEMVVKHHYDIGIAVGSPRGLVVPILRDADRLSQAEIEKQINDFVKGVKIALKPNGVNTFEFPHLCNMIELNQFDTIYHEHFSYFSLITIKKLFSTYELRIFDVELKSSFKDNLNKSIQFLLFFDLMLSILSNILMSFFFIFMNIYKLVNYYIAYIVNLLHHQF